MAALASQAEAECLCCGQAIHQGQLVRLECCGASEFCCSCLETWMVSQNTCPNCRARVRRFSRPGGRPDFVLSEDRDREIAPEDEETRPDVLDPEHWISDENVQCIGNSRCKWRNGEFDALSMSAQIELEGENCSIQCDQCTSWYHSFCVGFQSREALPSEDVEWVCPICAGALQPAVSAVSQQRRQRPATTAAAEPALADRRAAAAAAAERRAAATTDPNLAAVSTEESHGFAAVSSSTGSTNKKRRRRSSTHSADSEEEEQQEDEQVDYHQAARAAAVVSPAEPSRRGRARYRPRDRADAFAEEKDTRPSATLASARRAAATAARRAVPVSEGQSLSDRGSTFQALVAPCASIGSTDTTLRAIAARAISATTRSYAWRITETNDTDGSMEIVERYDDGGEHGAGERLLQLLQRADVRNVCLVVARWFGGTLLGPDRFKHVVTTARNLLLQEGLIGGWGVPESMNQGGVTLSTDDRVRQAVERRRLQHAQQQKAQTGVSVSTAGSIAGGKRSGPSKQNLQGAMTDGSLGSNERNVVETGGSASGTAGDSVSSSKMETHAATEAEELLKQLPGDFERIKANEARRRRVAVEARGASPKKPRYRNAPAAVAQREALVRDREEAQRQFQKSQQTQSPQNASGTSTASCAGASSAPVSSVSVGSSLWFAKRAASMASLNALIAPKNSDGATQSHRSPWGSVSIGRRRNRKCTGPDVSAQAEVPTVASSNGAMRSNTVGHQNSAAAERLGIGQNGGVRALYEKRKSLRENDSDDSHLSRSATSHTLGARPDHHETNDDSGEDDEAMPRRARSFAAEQHWRPVLQIRQRQRKAKTLLSVLEETGWSLGALQRNCDKSMAAVVVSQWHAAGMGGRSLVPPPAATLPWPVASTVTSGINGHDVGGVLGGATSLLRNKIPRVPKKTTEQRDMERRAEQQARAVREREEQQRAREKHQALEEHRSQHQDQHQQQAGKMVGDSPVSQPTDQTETGSAGANAIAAEAFLSRMQPTSPGQPAVSQDNTERKPQQQSQKHGAVVKVRGHAIDALSAVVKPALKRYYKSKAITSADDFKHLYAMKAKR